MIEDPKGCHAGNGGVVYTRWGRITCPNTPGTELVYAGRVGGTHYLVKGGGANLLCMTDYPEYVLPHRVEVKDYTYIGGAEYHATLGGSNDHNVPCAIMFHVPYAIL